MAAPSVPHNCSLAFTFKSMLCPKLQVALLSLTLCLSVRAQGVPDNDRQTSPPADAELQTVVVEGLKNPHRTSLVRLYEGVAAFNADRQLAPQASLRFVALDARPSSAPLVLKLDVDGRRMPIELDASGGFELPLLAVEQAQTGEIVANRRTGDVRVRPVVRTPGTVGDSRRLGDLRLECSVAWAIEKEEVPVLFRAAFAVAGGACNSSKVSFSFPAPRKLLDAQLAVGERRGKVSVTRGGLGYWPPLHDLAWPDEALVTFTFAAPLPQTDTALAPPKT